MVIIASIGSFLVVLLVFLDINIVVVIVAVGLISIFVRSLEITISSNIVAITAAGTLFCLILILIASSSSGIAIIMSLLTSIVVVVVIVRLISTSRVSLLITVASIAIAASNTVIQLS